MDIVTKGYDMKRVLFLILCFGLTLVTAKDISSRNYDSIDEQLAYNVIKKIFVSNEHESIVDTNWSILHISKRSTTGYTNIDVSVDNILLETKYNEDTNSKAMTLKIFSNINDKNSFVSSDSFLHTLVWNRIEYALGFDSEWIECVYSLKGLFYLNHPLCSVDKEILEIKK
jgi:hypothetical protein